MAAAIPAVIGLFMQQDANRRAQNTADEARKRGDALTKRQIDAYDALNNSVKGMDARGEFDPGNAVNRYGRDVEIGASRAGAGLAGASRVAGFKAGDSPISQGLQGISDAAALDFARGSEGIRTEARNRRLDAYGAAANAGGGLNAAISRYSNQEANALGSQSSLGGAISTIANSIPIKGTSTATPVVAPQANQFQMAPTTLEMPNPVTFGKDYQTNAGVRYNDPYAPEFESVGLRMKNRRIKGIRY